MDYPLNKSIDALDLDNVRGQFAASKEKGSEPDRLKASLERALRAKALSLGSSGADISAVEAFVQFVISLAKEEICPKTLTIQILQDIFDVSTTARCAVLFTIVETHIDTWKTSFFFDSCKNMVLRMCNDLLKRLSRTIDTTFCGRILILLAKSLPLNEKSGLNLTGQFNTQNVTIYDRESKEQLDDPAAQAPVDDDMEIGEIREHKDAGGSIPVDHNLYIKFWDLQRVFSNPNLLFEPEQFKKFETDIADLFGLFAAYKLEKPQRQREHSPSRAREATETNGMDEMKMEYKKTTVNDYNKSTSTSQSQMNGCSSKMEIDDKDSMDVNGIDNTKNAPTSDHEPTFFAKYLTSQKLFPLQLADSQFRRYFLLQFLIVSNYLNSKARLKDVDLTAAQETSIKELTEKCYSLLRDTYPHGTHFADSVRKLLGRERQWSTWKNEGCPDLIAQLLNSSERKCAVFKRKPVSRHDANFIDLGNRELTRLWNIESNNLQACKNIERKCIPVLRQFLEEALDEMDPVQQVEDQYQSVNEEKYQWMASRFLLFNSDHYINCAVVQQDTSAKIPEELNPTATILRKAIQLTAEHMPELKSRAEQIQAHQKKLELEAKQAEEARLMKLAAKTRELEKRIKQEEEEQRAQQQQQQQAVQIKKEKEASNPGTNAGSYNEVKKEVAAELHNEQQHSPQKPSQNSSSRAHSPSTTKRSSERSSERQKPIPAPATASESVEKEETVPKKRVKREPPTENSNSSTASPSSSQRKREKEEPTPEHDQGGGGGGHRSGTAVSSKKAEDKEARKSEADEKDRKSRKRHAEKSEERKSHSSVKGERKGGSSGRSRASSTDREHNHRGAVANENDRLKKRK